MRECQMQISGPWPPYHFVHKLTRGVHQQPQPAAAVPAQPVLDVLSPAIQLAEPLSVLA
jgi:hypothetical protein